MERSQRAYHMVNITNHHHHNIIIIIIIIIIIKYNE
jgi:hypothetical protein